ncbi:GIY-YIG nuclease family protein [Algoriphagus sp. oki45]|uniref:GIY-YIG nuclease family protein n=1 Tax=Algoriphagus sp. oki45 TaxID=3067294 RepID=UPI0030C77DC8
MNYCYILFSPSLRKFYTGITKDSIEAKIQKHNEHAYGKHHFTAKSSDWELLTNVSFLD